MEATEHCTTVEAAEILHVHRSTVTRMAETGELEPAMKLPGRTGPYLFDRAEIEAIATAFALVEQDR